MTGMLLLLRCPPSCVVTCWLRHAAHRLTDWYLMYISLHKLSTAMPPGDDAAATSAAATGHACSCSWNQVRACTLQAPITRNLSRGGMLRWQHCCNINCACKCCVCCAHCLMCWGLPQGCLALLLCCGVAACVVAQPCLMLCRHATSSSSEGSVV